MNQRMGEIVKTAVATNKRRKGIIANTEHKHNGMVWYGRATKLMLCVQQYSAYFSRTDVVGWEKNRETLVWVQRQGPPNSKRFCRISIQTNMRFLGLKLTLSNDPFHV